MNGYINLIYYIIYMNQEYINKKCVFFIYFFFDFKIIINMIQNIILFIFEDVLF